MAGNGPEPRDPLLPHLVWEGVLFVVALGCVTVMVALAPAGGGGTLLTNFLITAGTTGLLASGVAVSMRTATPNLAAGAIFSGAGLVTAWLVGQHHWSLPVAGFVAVTAATLAGVLLGGLTGVLSVPGWAVTFGAATAIQGAMIALTPAGAVTMADVTTPSGALWFTLFVLVSLGGGAVWLIPPVRRVFGSSRRVGDPAMWGGIAAVGAVGGLTVSCLLAGLSGVVFTQWIRSATVVPGNTLAFALGAVLLGGVSVFGRRAGIAGTLLGVVAITALQTALALRGSSSGVIAVLAAAAIVLGLPVSRLLETFSSRMSGRPPAAAGAPLAPAMPPSDPAFTAPPGAPGTAPASGPTYEVGPLGGYDAAPPHAETPVGTGPYTETPTFGAPPPAAPGVPPGSGAPRQDGPDGTVRPG
ncbi:ABC transporter permease [Actinocatenispora rupis]|uniref:Ribose/xylose/arabinose/galactoside ABC-type transport system, permease component n=1 Tax=Actinocatenispora rupis TaxID=519421 RepID=A0A8J3J4H3_9ACTN|nr:ABC transporter permease [Actinocatenispora rupis]GID15641.1 hypothetical protein Aru02nite_65300 [Actinocatenispora rupis]